MRYLVIAGGSADELPDDGAELGRFDVIVCADGGVHNARRLGLTPDIVVGDLDSLGAPEQARLQALGCRFSVHPAAKDETDLELALLWCVREGSRQVSVIGAFGGRPDHLLANLLLLADARFKAIELRLRARRWEVWLARGETTIAGQAGDTVSLIPLSETVSGVVTDGLLYPLCGETLRRGPARGVSNVMHGATASVRFRRGLLVVMHGPAQ
jgi:thiamine pyrophosphokinase